MQFIRSLIFYILFIMLCALMLPLFMIMNYWVHDVKLCDYFAKFWGYFILTLMRKILKLDYRFEGMEKLKKIKGPVIIASKHQSVWETIAFAVEFDRCSFILKKELKRWPIFGKFIQILPFIFIDRRKPVTSLQSMIVRAKIIAKDMERNIIIFPEGTRTRVGSNPNYSDGIFLLYKNLEIPVVCVSLNSGVFWPKHQFIKKSGTIVAKIENIIQPGLDREHFKKKLVNSIEGGVEELIKQSVVV